jgi:tetratricopeptide (TPR) repeat protein
MKKLFSFFPLLIIILGLYLMSMSCYAQADKEADARKLYLEASQLVRSEEFTLAEEKLKTILSDYSSTEIALKADELLNSIMDKVKAASLPTVPGYYVLLKNGSLVELKKLRVVGTDITFLQQDAVEIYADEFDKFFVYNPKTTLSAVTWSSLTGYPAPKGQPTSNWRILPEFQIPTKQGVLTNDKVVFTELKTGLFEVKFPDKFSPTGPIGAVLTDGTPYVGVVIIRPEMVDALYPLMEYWKTEQMSAASTLVNPLIRKYPEKPELNLIAGVIQYKQSSQAGSGPEKALKYAQKGIDAGNKQPSTPRQVLGDLESLLGQCRTDSAIAAGVPDASDSKDLLRTKLTTLESFDTWAVGNANFKWFNAKALLHCKLGEYDKALALCDQSIELFKTYGNLTSFLGITIQTNPNEEAKFSIQKALNDFSKDNKNRAEKLKDYIESEKILDQVEREYIQVPGDPEKGLKLVESAEDKDDNNERVFILKATFYDKLGKADKAKDARKDAEEKKNKRKEWE